MGVEVLCVPCPKATGKAWACVGRGLIVFPFLFFFLSFSNPYLRSDVWNSSSHFGSLGKDGSHMQGGCNRKRTRLPLVTLEWLPQPEVHYGVSLCDGNLDTWGIKRCSCEFLYATKMHLETTSRFKGDGSPLTKKQGGETWFKKEAAKQGTETEFKPPRSPMITCHSLMR